MNCWFFVCFFENVAVVDFSEAGFVSEKSDVGSFIYVCSFFFSSLLKVSYIDFRDCIGYFLRKVMELVKDR